MLARIHRQTTALVLLALLAALSLSATALGQETAKKKSAKKSNPKAEKAEKPEVSEATSAPTPKGDSPFHDLQFLMEQAPRFVDFPKLVYQSTMSVVAFQGKEMLFLDGCQATRLKKSWQISQCRAARASEGDFLARLVRMGAQLTQEPLNSDRLNDLFAKLRKVKKLRDLDGLMSSAVDKSLGDYRPAPEMEKDFEVCGAKRYAEALATLPSLAYLGDFVVLVDFSYSLYSSRPVVVRLVAGRTAAGWKLSKLRVSCQP